LNAHLYGSLYRFPPAPNQTRERRSSESLLGAGGSWYGQSIGMSI
jgi:hypothetical protein